jgi:hypothetical protein
MSFNVGRQNFENMVHFNANKLRLIQRGWDAYKVLTLAERKRLVAEGILVYGSRSDDLFLSDEAKVILNEIYKNELE